MGISSSDISIIVALTCGQSHSLLYFIIMSVEMPDWTDRFTAIGAVYVRPPGRPKAPHVNVLKSPKHTDAYFNSDLVERSPGLMAEIADQQAAVLLNRGEVPKLVVGHAPYAILPAGALAVAFHAKGFDVGVAYTMRDNTGGYSTSFDIVPGTPITVLADDIVSGDSTRKTIADLEERGGDVLGSIPCYANLLGEPHLDDRPIVAAATFDAETYDVTAERCQFCALGSAALQPRANWAELQTWMAPA